MPIERGITRQAALLIGEEAQTAAGRGGRGGAGASATSTSAARLTGSCSPTCSATSARSTWLSSSDLEDDGYLRDDLIGRAGIEATFEEELRGTYGTELKERDAQGRP